jgi:DNA helicase-2/ATP-dependent DNA helicase PcrA
MPEAGTEALVTRTFTLKAHRPSVDVDFERDLNEQQRAVATAGGGPMLVIAGAGSGKTRALTYRLAWLVRQGVDPGRVLLMTFTNRAAREMVQRVEQLARHDAQRIWAGTFHHIANRMLRGHGARCGVAPDFTILDREDAGDLMGTCVTEAGIGIARRRFPQKAVLVAIASFAANTLRSLETVLAERYPMFLVHAEAIGRVLELYARRKRERQLLDYDDLLTRWRSLLEEHADVRDVVADRFLHVLVDEYQDTNAIQGRIVDLLASRHRNLCVVGDDAQAIYSFRGASVANMLDFRERYPDARAYRLEMNYRSTPEILALANASIACNGHRLPKVLRADRRGGLKPAVVPCGDHFIQSSYIAEYILHLLDEGRSLVDIAVLYRSHWHALEIQLELQARNIPFHVRGGLRFFEQAHIKDVLGFLRLHHNPRDELAWHRVLRLLPRIGGRLAGRVWGVLARADDPLAAARAPGLAEELPPAARPSLAEFSRLLARLAGVVSPGELLSRIMDEFYADHLAGRYENARLRVQDIEGVIDFAAAYRTVESFLSDVALTGDFSGETCVNGPEEQLFVTLSTVHQAKGLEWPVVLVPWVCDGRFPTDLAMNTPEDLEEERRVFHVAITRARDELYLVTPKVWSTHRHRRVLMKPSRFLSELPDDGLLETMHLEGELPHVTAGPEAGADG